MSLELHITSTPPGEAPLWVREKWIGVCLPLAQRTSAPRSVRTFGVLSGPREFSARLFALLKGQAKPDSGYIVNSSLAISILDKSSPEAAAWWRENAPHMLAPQRYFVFQQCVGYVEGTDA